LRHYSTATFGPVTPSRVNPIPFTFTWDEAVAGFEAHIGGWMSRVTVTGGRLTASSIVTTNSQYAFTVVGPGR
jgi:hypothetical protein